MYTYMHTHIYDEYTHMHIYGAYMYICICTYMCTDTGISIDTHTCHFVFCTNTVELENANAVKVLDLAEDSPTP